MEQNYQTDILHKTITLKDQQITELLDQLKKTQQLHQNLKKKFLTEQQTLRDKSKKLQQIVEELRRQNTELINKYKKVSKQKAITDDQLMKVSRQWDEALSEINQNMMKLKYENEIMFKEKRLMKEQIEKHKTQKKTLQSQLQQLQKQLQQQQHQQKQLHLAMEEKELHWQKEIDQMASTLASMNEKTIEKRDKIERLSELEQKVRNILIQF